MPPFYFLMVALDITVNILITVYYAHQLILRFDFQHFAYDVCGCLHHSVYSL